MGENLLDVYLAGPYTYGGLSHARKRMMEATRYRMLTQVAATIMEQGLTVYSAITHSHPMTEYEVLSGEWEYWEKVDRVMIGVCRELWVYKMPGWDESVGVREEMAIALELGKRVFMVEAYPNLVQLEIDAYKAARMGL